MATKTRLTISIILLVVVGIAIAAFFHLRGATNPMIGGWKGPNAVLNVYEDSESIFVEWQDRTSHWRQPAMQKFGIGTSTLTVPNRGTITYSIADNSLTFNGERYASVGAGPAKTQP